MSVPAVQGTPLRDPAPVLVVDDDGAFRRELSEALSAAGYAVCEAECGREGLQLLSSCRPVAVLVSGSLPDMDCATVLRSVRLDDGLRGTPCILLTAAEDRRGELKALDAGADAFARKDDDVGQVLSRLDAVLRSREHPPGTPVDQPQRPRILAVDDTDTYLESLVELLRDEGYEVFAAGSGEEALALLAVQAVDCILLDVRMPGLGGIEACRRIKASPVVRDTPLILLTAFEGREGLIGGLATGADDYIAKSSPFEVLRARVRAQLRRKYLEEENRRIRRERLEREFALLEAEAARELAETRAALVDELERKNRELEAFVSSVSHDLRTPLRSIDGFSQALAEDYSALLDERARDYLGRVRGAAQRMSELIDDLLHLARVSRAELRHELVALSELVQSVGAELAAKHPERRLELQVEPDLSAWADRALLRVALENLLDNAWKFTGKRAAPRVEFGASKGREGPVFFVRDNGAGFDMTYASKMFLPFQRLHRESEFPGTGIGLATAWRVVDRHGGRLWAEGAEDAGATFYFTLPRAGRGGGA